MAVPHGLRTPCQSMQRNLSHENPTTTPPQTPSAAPNGFLVPSPGPGPTHQTIPESQILNHYQEAVNTKWKRHYECELTNIAFLHNEHINRILVQKNAVERQLREQSNTVERFKSQHSIMKDELTKQKDLTTSHEESQRASEPKIKRLQTEITAFEKQKEASEIKKK